MNEIPEGTPESKPSEPTQEVGFKDIQTPQNTPMKTRVPDQDEIIRDLTPEEIEQGALRVMLGNTKKQNDLNRNLIFNWLGYSSSKIELLQERISQETFDRLEAQWIKFVEENYPKLTPDDVTLLAEETYEYMSSIQDEFKLRSRVIHEEDLTNSCNRGGNFTSADIVGKKPSSTAGSFSISQKMRRAVVKSKGENLNFDVLLRNSYVAFTFSRPDRTQMGSLIADINRTIGGYVRQINHNSLIVAKIASMQAIWNFISKRIISSSVSDVGNFGELAKVILITDFDQICMSLIEAFNTNGVNLHLRCLNSGCNWEGHKLVDPKLLVRHRPSLESETDQAIYGNLFNGLKTLTVKETLELSHAQTYGLDSNRVYNENKDIYFGIKPPTLAEAFEAFNFFIEDVNPKIQHIRSTEFDTDTANAKIDILLQELGSTEYLHWVDSFVVVGEPGTDQQDEELVRGVGDNNLEFLRGIRDTIIEDNTLNRELVKFVLNKVPSMSKIVTGIRNYSCPSCGKNTEDLQDPEKQLDHVKGYLPIDPVMSFFTLTQLAMTRELANQIETKREVLSN